MRNTVIVAAAVLVGFTAVTLGLHMWAGNRQASELAPVPAAEVPEVAPPVSDPAVEERPRYRARMDANADGVITYEEAIAVHPEMTVEQYNARDTDGNGVWGRDEGFGPGSGEGAGRGMGGRGGGVGRGAGGGRGYRR